MIPYKKEAPCSNSDQASSTATSRATRLTYGAHLHRQDRPLGDLAINQTKKPQPFLVPIAWYADGDEGALRRRWGSQLAALDGVSWIVGTLFYSAEHSRKGMPSPARQRR